MFGTNEIIGQKFFKEAPLDSLFVTSMFFTLQGEGPYAGMPAVFIRLAKCNLACSFCDTFFDDGEWMTYKEIETKIYHTICDYWNSRGEVVPLWAMPIAELNTKLGPFPNIVLVITGGEPLLQSNLSAFLDGQAPKFKAVQIETNGTVVQHLSDKITVVCSPKCYEHGGKPIRYLAPSELVLRRANCLKFVMSAESGPYNEVPEWAHEWKERNPNKEIYCSPMNVYNDFPQKIKLLRAEKGTITMAERSTIDETIDFWEDGLLNLSENEKNHKYTGRYCLDHGFKLNLQQHLYAGMA